jgi:hypothetical protein
MEVLNVDQGDDWSLTFTCVHCETTARAGRTDLEADSFKVSGYHFDKSAQSARRLYVVCPTCAKLYFLSDEEVATVPYLLNRAATDHYLARHTAEMAAHIAPDAGLETV